MPRAWSSISRSTRWACRRLEARSAVDNGRGNGALRKLGAMQEGVLRRAFRKDDRAMDAALWTILSDDWRQLRGLLALRHRALSACDHGALERP